MAAKFVQIGRGHGRGKVKLQGSDEIQTTKERDGFQVFFTGQKLRQGIWDKIKEPTRYGRTNHYFKIKPRQQKPDVGKYSFLFRTVND